MNLQYIRMDMEAQKLKDLTWMRDDQGNEDLLSLLQSM
jgi:hypothetical protein